MATEEITITAADGGTFTAHLARPITGLGAALIVLPEIYNSNDHIRSVAEGFAAQGYLALAPDVYWRNEPNVYLPYTPEGQEKARAMNAKLDVDKLVEDLGACVTALKARDDCNGKVGATGFCLGGKLAYLCGTRLGIDAVVGYYGVKIDSYLDEANKLACPTVLHFAENDTHVPPEAYQAIKDRLGDKSNVTINLYEGAEHGFNRKGYPPYHAEAADQAMTRTLVLFSTALETGILG